MAYTKSFQRIVLSYLSEPKLTPEEYRKISEAKKHLDTIKRNIEGGSSVFEGLIKRDRQDLMAYVTFSKENGFTHVDKGHTPIEDSARDLIREGDLYDSEESLDKALVHVLNKFQGKPFDQKLMQDARGNTVVAE